MHRATLTLPEGLKILETRIIRDVPAKVDGQRVVRDNPTHLAPHEKSNLIAHVEVERAFAGEEITCEALPGPLGDSTAENNVARLEIGATSGVGSGTTPIWGGVLAVLLAGGGLFVVWRRRRRASHR
ncbi:LPXTG cell wall anchor domain-containing protein [Lentzea sp. PSKA42]|uniref:LPXTG cell wall anchor domain-containing protein n=1 Tax=Lentzea indica TaxID=2604800 RepID=A0ABX1FKB1_9PSEU|nr:LPXTG cell wall anchor domain-containing protein [Lentzea indica]NKE59429.1 LPXTG cell wall anchor domain-containing protein [Lentzea indica]